MSPYRARPSDKDAKKKEDYWVQLVRPADVIVGHEVVSSAGMSYQDAVSWLRQHRQDGDEVNFWRREYVGGGFKDVRQITREGDDEAYPDPERLAEILAPLREHFEGKATKRAPRRSAQGLAALGEAARARMRAAAEQLKGTPT